MISEHTKVLLSDHSVEIQKRQMELLEKGLTPAAAMSATLTAVIAMAINAGSTEETLLDFLSTATKMIYPDMLQKHREQSMPPRGTPIN